MSNDVGPTINHASELRSIANSIEPMFPIAADVLRGIARELDATLEPILMVEGDNLTEIKNVSMHTLMSVPHIHNMENKCLKNRYGVPCG